MKEKILAFLRDHPGQSPTIIADNIGAKPASARKALTILRRQKKVKRWGDGTYSFVNPPAEISSDFTAPSGATTATQS